MLVCGTFDSFATTCQHTESSSRGGASFMPQKTEKSLLFQNTQMRLAQCAWEGHWAEFEPARLILTDSMAVARQSKTRNRSRGSTWVYDDQAKTIYLISARAGASCTKLMGGRLGHVSICLADPGRFYCRDKTGPNTDFCKIPEKQLVWTCQACPSTVTATNMRFA